MTPEAAIAITTAVVSISVKLLGEPDQIRRNWRRRSADGLSPLLYALSLGSYVLWTIHGSINGDLTLVVAQAVGVITSCVILFQIFLYGRNKGG